MGINLKPAKENLNRVLLQASMGDGEGAVNRQNLSSMNYTRLDLTGSGVGWDNLTKIFTAPVSGDYLVFLRMRVLDNSASGVDVSFGINNTEADSINMSWFKTNGSRQVEINNLLVSLTAGYELRGIARSVGGNISLANAAMTLVLMRST